MLMTAGETIFILEISHMITSSLQLITSLVHSGECIAYLPKFFEDKMGFEQIKISHCEFNCEQNIYLSTSKHEKIGWISNVLSGFKLKY